MSEIFTYYMSFNDEWINQRFQLYKKRYICLSKYFLNKIIYLFFHFQIIINSISFRNGWTTFTFMLRMSVSSHRIYNLWNSCYHTINHHNHCNIHNTGWIQNYSFRLGTFEYCQNYISYKSMHDCSDINAYDDRCFKGLYWSYWLVLHCINHTALQLMLLRA